MTNYEPTAMESISQSFEVMLITLGEGLTDEQFDAVTAINNELYNLKLKEDNDATV